MARPRKPAVTLNLSKEEAEITLYALMLLNVTEETAAIAKRVVMQMARALLITTKNGGE